MSPRTQVSRRLFPPIFLPNIGHNQSVSRIIALTFLTKNVSNKSAFFVQRAHPYRAFLRNYIGTNITVPTASTASTPLGGSTLVVLITKGQSFHHTRLVLETIEQSTCSHRHRAITSTANAPIASTASATTGGSTILVLEPIEQPTYSLNYRVFTTSF